VVAFCVLSILSISSASAQIGADAIEPDAERLIVPLGTQLFLALPGHFKYASETVPDIDVSTASSPDSLTVETHYSALNIRIQPALFFQPNFAVNLVKLAVDADFQVPLGTRIDPLLTIGASDTLPDTSSNGRARLSQSYLLVMHDYFAVTAGLVRSHFGLGSLANSGNAPAYHSIETAPHSFRQGGDRLWRAQAVVFPLGLVNSKNTTRVPLAILTAVDAVHADDTTVPDSDDDTRQWVIGFVTQWTTGSFSTGYIRRFQAHSEGGDTDVNIGIVSGNLEKKLGSNLRLKASGEYAVYLGESTLSQSVIDPAPLDIFAEGGIARFGLGWGPLDSLLETGYASGDRNAFDRTQNTFRFDSNYRVGTLLYPHLLRTFSAASARNIDDPNFRAEAPRGFDTIATQGAVENSVYINPRVLWRINTNLSVNAGWLHARSATPWTDPYRSSLNGGTPTGPNGRIGSTDLGQEWHVGADFTMRLLYTQWVSRAWFTHCKPGRAFDDVGGKQLDAFIGTGFMTGVLW